MERLSKSLAKEYYLLNDEDLDDLSFITKNNYLNNSNEIKLFKKDDIVRKAIAKYGNLENIIDIAKKMKENRKNKKQ